MSLKSWQIFYLSERVETVPRYKKFGFICQAKNLLSLDKNLETRKAPTGYLHLCPPPTSFHGIMPFSLSWEKK